jgi:hypothetical protein
MGSMVLVLKVSKICSCSGVSGYQEKEREKWKEGVEVGKLPTTRVRVGVST